LHAICATVERRAGDAQGERRAMLDALELAAKRFEEHALWKRGALEDDLHGLRSEGLRRGANAVEKARIHCELAALSGAHVDTTIRESRDLVGVDSGESPTQLSCAWPGARLRGPAQDVDAFIAELRREANRIGAVEAAAATRCRERVGFGPGDEAPTVPAHRLCAALAREAMAANRTRAAAVAAFARALAFDDAVRRGAVDPTTQPTTTSRRFSVDEVRDARHWHAASLSWDLEFEAAIDQLDDIVVAPLDAALGALHMPVHDAIAGTEPDVARSHLRALRATAAAIDELQAVAARRCARSNGPTAR
jgi:hypothetical protein